MSAKGQSSPINSPEAAGIESEEAADDAPANAAASGNAFKKPQSPKTAKAKGTRSVREPHQIGTVSSQEEMEPKVLLFQNKKLAERLDHYRVTTEELRNRNEQLQQRLSATDSEIFIINRHMKSLDENVRMLLRRFENEDLTEDAENPRSPLESLLLQLSTLDEEELDKTLSGRVQETRNLIGKLVQVYETVWNQSRTVLEKLKNGEDVDENRRASIDQVLRKNEILENQALSTQVKCDSALSETSKLKDRVTELETERDELKNREADLSWSLDKEQTRREKAENMVVELRQKITALENQVGTKKKQGAVTGPATPIANVSQTKMGEMVTDLENQKSLAANRLDEIKKLHDDKAALVLELDELKVKVQSAPDDVVINNHLYKSLQVDYAVLCTQHEKLKEYYQMAKDAVGTLRATYLQQLKEAQRHEEDGSHLLQEYLSSLQTVTIAARTDYQRLKIEFEQERACRETSGTSKDYDKLFKSVMEHNHSMQREVERLRKKNLSLQSDLAKVQPKDLGRNLSRTGSSSPDKRTFDGEHKARDPGSVERTTMRQSGNTDYMGSPDTHGESSGLKELKKQLKDKTKEYDELKLLYDMTKQASKINRELVEIMASERKLKDENAELRRTAATAEERVATAESACKSATETADVLKVRNKSLEDRMQDLEREREKEKTDRQRGGPDDEMHKRIRVLEDSLSQCKKALQNRKEEEDAMMNEMEITGQALEDLQNQNKQLIDQLKEKDGTNLKWMSDSIRNNQIIKTLKDDKAAQESRFRIASDTLNKYEKQLVLADERIKCIEEANALLEEDRKSADYLVDSWKRKAFEQTKEANDLHLKLDQLEKEFKFARTVHADKLKSYEGDVYKARRLMEENSELKRKLERVKLIEVTGSSEEILREDLREYKELLNCPSCKSARKDTVLTKCFHVFCNSCISKRYESRQRRCPQCSTPFGANDYRRLFLG